MGYTCGVRWTNEKIKSELINIIKALNLDRMPSNSEIKMVTGDSRLTNAIRRNGGFYYWADILNIEIKNCETQFGKSYEKTVSEMLAEKGFKVEQMTVKHPYDLLVNDNIKVDVKAARKYFYTDKSYFYTFNLEKKNPTCDIYVCLTVDNEEIQKIYIIPSKYAKITQLSVGENSVYGIYLDRWDYFNKFNEFYKELA